MKSKQVCIFLCLFLWQTSPSFAQLNWSWAATGGKGINPSSHSAGCGIDFDQNNNTYLTGSISSPAKVDTAQLTSYGSSDILIAKYGPSGNLLWAKTAGGALPDIGKSITVSNGYLYVCGFFAGTANFDNQIVNASPFWPSFFVAKLDTDGHYIWIKYGDAFGIINITFDPLIAIQADHSNHIYVAGYCVENTQLIDTVYHSDPKAAAFYVMQLDTAGNLNWLHVKKGSTTVTGGIGNTGVDLAIDQTDNVVYTASLPRIDTIINGPSSTTFYDNLLAGKISSSGNLIWEKEYGDTVSYVWGGHPKAMALDANDNIFIAGTYYKNFLLNSSPSGNGGGFITKINSANGNVIMAKPFSASNNSIPAFKCCDYDDQGNIRYAGWFCGAVDFGGIVINPIAPDYDCDNFVASYDTSGNLNWVVRYGYADYDFLNGSASNNTMYAITGSFKDSLTLGSLTLRADTFATNADFFFLGISTMHSTAISVPNSDLAFNIYPNPASDQLYFESNDRFDAYEIDLYAMDGKLIKSYGHPVSNGIDVSGLSAGMYFISLKGKKAICIQRFLKI